MARSIKKASVSLLLAVGLCASGITAAPSASAAVLEGQGLLMGPASGSSRICIDGSISQGLRPATCDRSNRYQQWRIIYLDETNTYYEIYHPESGRCVDFSVSQGFRLLQCNRTEYQKWTTYYVNYFGPSPIGFWIWRSGTDRCIDGSLSQGIRGVQCDENSRFQSWEIW